MSSISLPLVGTKTCNKCRQEKSILEFNFHRHVLKSLRDGNTKRMRICRMCWRAKFNSAIRLANRNLNRNLRNKVIDGLGGSCARCGEDEYKWLSIDHIGGWGKQHRKELGGGRKSTKQSTVLRDIIKRGFPKDKFQLLCWNCHMSLHHYGECPHKEMLKLAIVAAHS